MDGDARDLTARVLEDEERRAEREAPRPATVLPDDLLPGVGSEPMSLRDALADVDGELTEQGVIEAIEALGEVPTNAGPPGTISADKHDAGDFVILARYSAADGVFTIPDDAEPFEVPA